MMWKLKAKTVPAILDAPYMIKKGTPEVFR